LYAPSHPVVVALAKALPYVAGASGNINIMAHTIAHLKSRNVPIDAKYALLSTMMVLHSGHSLHESLWVINLLGPRLDLGIDLGNHPPDSFVSDYDRFIELFQDADGKEKMEAARQRIEDRHRVFPGTQRVCGSCCQHRQECRRMTQAP
jgi:hypothetical protein